MDLPQACLTVLCRLLQKCQTNILIEYFPHFLDSLLPVGTISDGISVTQTCIANCRVYQRWQGARTVGALKVITCKQLQRAASPCCTLRKFWSWSKLWEAQTCLIISACWTLCLQIPWNMWARDGLITFLFYLNKNPNFIRFWKFRFVRICFINFSFTSAFFFKSMFFMYNDKHKIFIYEFTDWNINKRKICFYF